jgi:hypothetical protein
VRFSVRNYSVVISAPAEIACAENFLNNSRNRTHENSAFTGLGVVAFGAGEPIWFDSEQAA